MPSLLCELFCDLAPQMAGHLSSPWSTPGTGHSSHLQPQSVLRCCISMEMPLCLLPGLSLVWTSFSYLLSGWWDSVAAARSPSPPRLSRPQALSAHVSSQKEWAARPNPRPGHALPLGLFPGQPPGSSFLWSPAHREESQTLDPSPCALSPAWFLRSQASLPSCAPLFRKGLVCTCGLSLPPWTAAP